MSGVCYFAANTRALALDFRVAILKHARRTKHKYVHTLLGRMYFFALHGLCDVFTARCKWACAAAAQTPHTPRHTHHIAAAAAARRLFLTSRTIRQSVLLEECVSKYCVVQMRAGESVRFAQWGSHDNILLWI
jgi:hypothetical protein